MQAVIYPRAFSNNGQLPARLHSNQRGKVQQTEHRPKNAALHNNNQPKLLKGQAEKPIVNATDDELKENNNVSWHHFGMIWRLGLNSRNNITNLIIESILHNSKMQCLFS